MGLITDVLSGNLALMKCRAPNLLLPQHLSGLYAQLSWQSWCFWQNQSRRSWLMRSWLMLSLCLILFSPFVAAKNTLWDLEIKDQGCLLKVVPPAAGPILLLLYLLCEQEFTIAGYQHKNGQCSNLIVDRNTWSVAFKQLPSSLGSLGSREHTSLIINRNE